ncbi:AMP-binding protein [Streptomyces sp. B1866]|uniref:AMP-binding protein n=1 Tax=Streptomyces sp. B1866 TaxID=3075431 RepID=UPI00288FF544|nr:AMP-binding protein [Streptomyces sp. B1866]MDT3398211.1 AMP-binding protein [Streptomyces sp. B1866]
MSEQSGKRPRRPGGRRAAGPPEARPVHRMVEDQARLAPSAPAVVRGGDTLSYAGLDRASGRLARRLRAAGVPAGGLVAVCLEDPADAVVGMLGVLRAGGAYVPVAPGAPEPHLRHVLADAGPVAVVARGPLPVALADAVGADRAVVLLDDTGGPQDTGVPDAPGVSDAPGAPSDADAAGGPAGAADVACVLYTAGTTGPATGALTGHQALARGYAAWRAVFRLTPADRYLTTVEPEFAGFTAAWVRALCSGGTLVLPAAGPEAGPAGLREEIVRAAVTVLDCGVHVVRDLHRHLRVSGLDLGAVRLVAAGGDSWYLDEQLELRRTLGPRVRILGVYGPAEAAGGAAYFELPDRPAAVAHPERLSLIGVPFPHVTVTVAGPGGAPVGPGAVGELVLGGPGAALGRVRGGSGGGRRGRGRTGDLGRVREDGRLEHLGRRGGHADAEAVLRGHPSVAACLVAEAGTGAGRPEPVAYVVPADGGRVDPGELRLFLSARLPRDRAPRAVVPVAALPRTRAGKADRSGLPRPVPRGAAGPGTGGKASAALGAPTGPGASMAALTGVFTLLAMLLTDTFWPGSTDVSLVPQPWATLFEGLYLCECLAFGLGVAFLAHGRPLMARLGRSPGLTAAAHLAIVWLLVSWWPQDNSYRLAGRTDWARQAALVYGFNVTLMLAGAVAAVFAARRPADR